MSFRFLFIYNTILLELHANRLIVGNETSGVMFLFFHNFAIHAFLRGRVLALAKMV